MSFYKKYRNNENYREQQFSTKKMTRFQVSDKSFQSATIVSSLVITVFAFILFVIRKNFAISESDIQTVSGITAGLCGFALAIPLFLKDFDISSNFWKQFYLIAITFLVASFVGVISFLLIDDLKSINITLWFFLSIVISVNITNVNLLWNKTKFKVSLNPILNLSISYLALFLSLFLYKGDFWISATILFTIYGFYLTLTLMLAILVELLFANKKTEDNDTRIKKAIQRLVEKYKEQALDEQTLLDKLKLEEFPNIQEIISRTKVQDLVTEMDSETADNEPKITIFEYDRTVIPRWRKEYDDIIETNHLCIFLSINVFDSDSSWDINRYKQESQMYEQGEVVNSYIYKNHIEKNVEEVFDIISKESNLSVELLKENNIINNNFILKKGRIKYVINKDVFNGYRGIERTIKNNAVFYCVYLTNKNTDLENIENNKWRFVKNIQDKKVFLYHKFIGTYNGGGAKFEDIFERVEDFIAQNEVERIWDKKLKDV